LLRVGRMARFIYDQVIPSGRLDGNWGEDASSVFRRVATATKLMGFTSADERTKLVEKVSALSDYQGVRSAASIPLMTPKYIDPKDRQNLISLAISTNNSDRTGMNPHDPHNPDAVKETSHYVIKEAHENGHLRIQDAASMRPGVLDQPKNAAWADVVSANGPQQKVLFGELKAHLTNVPMNERLVRMTDILESNLATVERKLPSPDDNSIPAFFSRNSEFRNLDFLADNQPLMYDSLRQDLLTADFQKSTQKPQAEHPYDERSRDNNERGR
jgi:hypothetical protein